MIEKDQKCFKNTRPKVIQLTSATKVKLYSQKQSWSFPFMALSCVRLRGSLNFSKKKTKKISTIIVPCPSTIETKNETQTKLSRKFEHITSFLYRFLTCKLLLFSFSSGWKDGFCNSWRKKPFLIKQPLDRYFFSLVIIGRAELADLFSKPAPSPIKYLIPERCRNPNPTLKIF